MNNSVIGLDIAKNIFHIYTMTAEKKPVKKVLKRKKLLEFFANYPASLIGIEACGSAHHWARELTKLGHEVKMIKGAFGKDFCAVTPGIRPAWQAGNDDQRRIVTPADAVKNGSDYLVIGRPIRDAKDPAAAAKRVADEIGSALMASPKVPSTAL